ncbi:hypothetical protein AC578_916 [Pseudocercospora eumusae]|uniref:Uncharacterized protein n=1 Tax=Pseudocercospora eumusae TaxID=321146 RepID=A0A139HC04_9PEZI|nr:hypothetical protein AC578_916 [Pseudocercospora eumusae]
MASVAVLSPDLLHKIDDYLNGPEHYWWKRVIYEHTGHRIPPRNVISRTSEPPPSSPPPTKTELLEKYLEYMKEELAARRSWRHLVRGLCVKLPTEMRTLVIKKHLESLFPRAVHHDHIRLQQYAKSFRSTVPVEGEFDVASTQIATEIFTNLTSQIADVQEKLTLPFKAQEMVDEIMGEAVKLIPKLCTYFLHANFPSRNSLTDEVVPTLWKPHVHNIKHLELSTRVMTYSGTKHYPVELFKVQDHIASLKNWFPELKSLAFTIIGVTDRPRAYLKRGFSQHPTTLAAETEKIVEEMQKLDVAEKGIRLCINNVLLRNNLRAYKDYDGERKSAWGDVSEICTDGLSCQEITTIAIQERLKLVRILKPQQTAGQKESDGAKHS